MKIVIEISEEDYKLIKSYGKGSTNYRISLNLYDAVRDGTPLPKHYGDLIDRNKLVPYCKFKGDCWADKCDSCSSYAVDYLDIKDAPTIIAEAEGSESE